jgi:hypothetical protein
MLSATLNAGLRYEFTTMPVERYGRDSALVNLSDPAPTVGPLYHQPEEPFSKIRLCVGHCRGRRASLRGGYGWFSIPTITKLDRDGRNPPASPRLIIASAVFPVPPLNAGSATCARWNGISRI